MKSAKIVMSDDRLPLHTMLFISVLDESDIMALVDIWTDERQGANVREYRSDTMLPCNEL